MHENTAPYVARFLSALTGVRATPTGWVAQCPATTHGSDGEDRNPSLRVSIGEAGKVLVDCRVGCELSAVLSAVGKSPKDLFCPPEETPMEPLASSPSESSDADHGLRDRVYRALLRRLSLMPDDARALAEERGLDAAQCVLRQYRTLSLLEARRLPQALYEEFENDLYLVPGFVRSDSSAPVLQNPTALVGVLVPVRDAVGRVAGLKTRRRGDAHPKYMAWSSSGASCGALVHCPVRGEDADLSTVRVTEGELKADVATALADVYTVSSPGVGNWRRVLPVLERLAPKRVLLSWDWPDVTAKPEVANQLHQFAEELVRLGYEVGLETWDEKCKGVDDALHNGLPLRQLWGDDGLRAIRDVWTRLSGLDSPVGRLVWEPRPFPLDVYPAAVRRFVEHVSALLQCAPDFPAAGVLLTACRALGTSRSIRLDGDWEEMPNLYGVVVAPPSSAKTPALMKSLRPLFKLQVKEAHGYAERKEEYKKEQKLFKAHLRDEPPAEPRKMVHYWVDDATTESMITRLESNAKLDRHDPALLYFRDEFLAVVRSLNAYRGKGADKEFFLKAWSGADVKVDRKTEDQTYIVSRPAISILGGIQPDMLPQVRVEGDLADGFLDRILFFFPKEGEPYRGSDLEADRGLFEAWDRVVRTLVVLVPENRDADGFRPKPVSLSPAARSAWRSWLSEIADRQTHPLFEKRLRGMYGKLRAHMGRFMLLLHMLHVAAGEEPNESTVSGETVRKASELIDYVIDHYGGVLRQIPIGPADRRIEDFVELVRVEYGGRVPLRRVYRKRLFDVKGLAEARALAKSAEDRGFGVVAKEDDARGRSREVFVLVRQDEE